MRIAFLGGDIPGGVSLYRLWNHAIAAQRLGHEVVCDLNEEQSYRMKRFGFDIPTLGATNKSLVDWGWKRPVDLIWTTYGGELERLSHLAVLRDKRDIPFIVDYDDMFSMVPGYNQAHSRLRETTRNAKVAKLFLREASATVTTTEVLRKTMMDSVGINSHVLPNFIVKEYFDTPRVEHDTIRIVFTGASGGRWPDMQFLEPVAKAILKKHGKARFIFTGALPAWALGVDNVYSVMWCETPAFFRLLKHLSPDIGLAPMQEDTFSSCKSAIKYYEYSMVGAAGVYADTAPYSEVDDGETGLVRPMDADSWIEAIDRLITDVDTRRRISHNAYEDVRLAHSRPGALAAVLEEVVNDRNCKRVTA